MAIKKIDIDEIRIGMYIDRLDVSWFKHPFLSNSFLISSEQDLQKLIKSGATEAYIDTEKGLYNFDAEARDYGRNLIGKWKLRGISSAEAKRLQDKVPLREELKVSRKIYYKTRQVIESAFKKATKGKPIDWDEIFKSADSITESVLRNKDAFLSLCMIKDYDQYTFFHSLNVACLCITIGRYLLFDKVNLVALGVGALLHDIGKVRIPEAIVNKPGRLTEEEFSVVKKHPEYALEILSQSPRLSWDSIHLAYQHHERFDGSGYPRNLKGLRINQFALIAAMADVFDAITTDRPYRKAMPVDIAMVKMVEWGEKDFYPSYLLKFIQCIGIYPVGTVVELDTREIGIVYEINHMDLEKPKLMGMFDSHYRRLKEPIVIDLASEEYSKVCINRCLDAGKIGINTKNFLENLTI